MQLKDTDEGKAWIHQFESDDQKDAILLLDSLRLISDDRFHGDVRRAVADAAKNLGDNIALYAVREVDKDELYYVNKVNRPVPVKPGKVGSEGAMSHIITNLERGQPQRYMNHPPLRSMKAKKTRHIMLLDDLSDSGNRVVEFIQSMRRSKTLVSWCSNQFVRFHLVAYSISENAENVIRSTFRPRKGNFPLVNISFTYAKRSHAPIGTRSRDDEMRLRRLCLKYGKRGNIKWTDIFGYRESMSALVFAHGCPNNVPGILWCSTKKWTALFPNRAIPDTLLTQVFPHRAALQATSVLSNGLEEGGLVRSDVIRLLIFLRRRIRETKLLADILDMTTAHCEHILAICRRYNLIDSNYVLTDFGRDELLRAERKAKVSEQKAKESRPFYIPKQLREARGNV